MIVSISNACNQLVLLGAGGLKMYHFGYIDSLNKPNINNNFTFGDINGEGSIRREFPFLVFTPPDSVIRIDTGAKVYNCEFYFADRLLNENTNNRTESSFAEKHQALETSIYNFVNNLITLGESNKAEYKFSVLNTVYKAEPLIGFNEQLLLLRIELEIALGVGCSFDPVDLNQIGTTYPDPIDNTNDYEFLRPPLKP